MHVLIYYRSAPSSLPENLKVRLIFVYLDTQSVISLSCSPRSQLLVEEVVDVIGGVSSSLRPVLQLLKRKPKSIKFYEPSYSDM